MGPIGVFLIQLSLAFPLWFAAYHRYGIWPCVALLMTQVVVAMAAYTGLKAK